MKNKEPKSQAQDFADTIKDNPQQIIKWARSEIREYKKFIKLLKKIGILTDEEADKERGKLEKLKKKK